MKREKRTLFTIFFVIVGILFLVCSTFWYNATKELYEYDNFKKSLIEDINNDPNLFKEEYNISGESELTDEIVKDIYDKSKIGRYIFIAALSAPISLTVTFVLFGPIFFISSVNKKYKKYKISIDDFEKNTGYYRDLLKNYNPLELSYNNDYNLNEDSLIAMSLYLEKKNILSLKDNKFFINKDKLNDIEGLEKEFISITDINDKGRLEVSLSKLINLVDKSCKKKKLLVSGDIPKKRLYIDIVKSVLSCIIVFIMWKNLDTILNILPSAVSSLAMFFILGLLIVLLVLFNPFTILMKYTLLYSVIKEKHSKRSDIGNEINYKLEGLKNFIRDFSILDERTKEEIVIWDDYLIYSVLFGDNKKIYSEMKDLVRYTV